MDERSEETLTRLLVAAADLMQIGREDTERRAPERMAELDELVRQPGATARLTIDIAPPFIVVRSQVIDADGRTVATVCEFQRERA